MHQQQLWQNKNKKHVIKLNCFYRSSCIDYFKEEKRGERKKIIAHMANANYDDFFLFCVCKQLTKKEHAHMAEKYIASTSALP